MSRFSHDALIGVKWRWKWDDLPATFTLSCLWTLPVNTVAFERQSRVTMKLPRLGAWTAYRPIFASVCMSARKAGYVRR